METLSSFSLPENGGHKASTLPRLVWLLISRKMTCGKTLGELGLND
jgi:hypothetical protein